VFTGGPPAHSARLAVVQRLLDAPLVPTIRQWFADWLAEREAHIAQAIRSLFEHLGPEADRPLPSLTTPKLQCWLDCFSEIISASHKSKRFSRADR